MKILNRHIGATIIVATLLVLLVLVGLQIFVSFINEVREVGAGHYGLWQVVQYTLLTLPRNIYSFFPMAGLLGSLLGLGYLASNNELVVMRTSGMSMVQIVWAVMRAAILLLIFATLIGELLGPAAMHAAQVRKEYDKTGIQVSMTVHGLWMRKDSTFIYIQDVLPDGNLHGVYQYKFNDNHQLLTASYTKQGSYHGDKWVLNNIEETKFGNNTTTSQIIPQQIKPIKIDLMSLSYARVDPLEVSLTKLYQLIHYRRIGGLSTQQYKLAFWQRILQPLSTLVMIFLSIPFIFGPLRTVAMGVRIVSGVMVGFTFYLLNQFLGPFSLVYQIPPLICAIFPSLLFLMVGFFLMRRAR
jgi:lipopolysaccharide export system permease protein